ncbi:MAG: hypothetical protein ACRDPT_08515 [Streptomycetales bacterium]
MRRLVPARQSPRWRRAPRWGVVLIVTALVPGALGVPPAAAAGNGWPVNLAIAINAGVDDRVTDLAWGVARTSRVPAFERNAALARSTGRDLTTAAAAFQVVLAGRAVGPVDAVNQARAINRDCLRCDTVALAYQFVVVSDDRIGLSRRARAKLARLRHDLAGVLRSSAGGREIVGRACSPRTYAKCCAPASSSGPPGGIRWPDRSTHGRRSRSPGPWRDPRARR